MTNEARTNVLITGASGFIGGALAERLAARSDLRVVGIVRHEHKGNSLLKAGAEVAVGDITDFVAMSRLFSTGFDVVFHIAAWLTGSPRRNFRLINVDATRELVNLALQFKTRRFIFTSSIMVYGLQESSELNETAKLSPYGDDYGDTKIEAEAIVRETGSRSTLETCIVRPGMVYGPRSQSWTIKLVEWGKLGVLPYVDGGGGSAYPIYIDNLVDLLELCLDKDGAANSIFNAVDDGPVTFDEFLGSYLRMIPTSKSLRLSGKLITRLSKLFSGFSPGRSLPYLAKQLTQTGLIRNDAAKTKLGWRPAVSLSNGMLQTEQWLRDAGYL